ncbi:MAG: hypothetical protein IJS28_07060 [Synergistaceae bacterium]|nr:hypothetical protein [Synergistaceae bacterium]
MNKLCPKCMGNACLVADTEHPNKWRAQCLRCGYHPADWRDTQGEALTDWEGKP